MDWLKSVDGGSKSERSAMKHRNVLMGILRYKEDGDIHINNFLKRDVLSMWINNMVTCEKKSGAIKTYLNSVKLYLDFIVLMKNPCRKDLSTIEKLKVQFRKWNKNLYKGIQKRKHEKTLLDIDRFPCPEDIRNMDDSEIVQEAGCHLRKLVSNCKQEPTQHVFTTVRDYLLSMLIFNNCSRPAGIYNMTLSEFEKGSRDEIGQYIVQVMQHKTDFIGPVNISIRKSLYNEMSPYIKHASNVLNGIGQRTFDFVFVSYSGNQMSSSLVTKQFNSFWKKVTGKESDISTTIVRKYTTTMVHTNHADIKKDVAHHLNHDLKTAEQNYDIVDKKRKAGSISSKIREIQRENTRGNEKDILFEMFKDEIVNGGIDTDQVNLKLHLVIDQVPGFKCSDKERKRILDLIRNEIKKGSQSNYECVEEPEETSTNTSKYETQKNYPEKRIRKVFSYDDNCLIQNYLKNYIVCGVPINRYEFEEDVRGIPEMSDLVNKFGIQGLIVKIRTERKKR